MEDDVTIYNRIARHRERRGLSREELAEALGVSRRTVGYLEQQDARSLSVRAAVGIARFFDAPFWDVFSTEPFAAEGEGLEPGEALIVEALSAHREAPVGYLAEATRLAPEDVVRHLGRLEEAGLVRTREVTERRGLLRGRARAWHLAALAEKESSEHDAAAGAT